MRLPLLLAALGAPLLLAGCSAETPVETCAAPVDEELTGAPFATMAGRGSEDGATIWRWVLQGEQAACLRTQVDGSATVEVADPTSPGCPEGGARAYLTVAGAGPFDLDAEYIGAKGIFTGSGEAEVASEAQRVVRVALTVALPPVGVDLERVCAEERIQAVRVAMRYAPLAG